MVRRSYLFVPGDRADRFEKAWNAGADAVIVDLEDAVTSKKKAEAREAVATWLSPEHRVYVRINGAKTEWFEADLAAVAKAGLAGILLPKAENAREVETVVKHIPEGATVVPILETALGIWNVRDIAEAPGVERIAFGSIDFQLDAGIDGEDEELLYARSRLVLASRIAGILPPLDGVTAALDNVERLAADVERARRLGFGGKLCIHPRQVDTVNLGFLPSEAEIAWARRVLEAVKDTQAGAVRLGGEMIDRPVVEQAKAILARVAR